MVYDSWKFKGNISINYSLPTVGNLSKVYIPWRPGMALDFKDIRFSVAGKPLTYAREEVSNGAYTRAWVKIPANTRRINYHYGRGGVVSEGNAAALNALFYDFLETGAADSGLWAVSGGLYGTAGIRTDKKYDNYSIGTDQDATEGQGSSTYDQAHTFIKIPLTSIPVGTTFSVYLKARRWKNTTGGGDFVGLGFGGTTEIYNLDCDDLWHEFFTEFTRTATGTWTVLIAKDGSQVYSGTKSKTFTTYFNYGVQTRGAYDFGVSMYQRMDNVLAWLGPITGTAVLNHYPTPAIQAAVISIEGANVGLRMHPEYSLRDQPITLDSSSLGMTPGFLIRAVTGGVVSLGMQAAVETHDTKIEIQTGLGLHAAASPLKYYLSVESSLKTAGTFARKDYIRLSEILYTKAAAGSVKFETLADYPATAADVAKTITDAVWQLQTTFIGPNAPGAFFPIHHEQKDHTDVTRHLFTGIIPQIDKEISSTGTKTSITAYDYGWYLSSQYIPDDARTMEVSSSWWGWGLADWRAWINYLLEDTGITAYRIRVGPEVVWKQFIFSNKTTKREAIDQISEYCGYIFEVKWRDYGTAENPDWRPVAYWVPVSDIEYPGMGLDIPSPVSLVWPDPNLVDLPKITTAPEERINRVRIIGSDPDGHFYSQTYETSAVTAGTELPREYMEESSALTSQAAVNAYASAMLDYFARPAVTVTMKFINRFDLQLYQRIQFGPGFPQELYSLCDGTNGIWWLRIVGIKYHTEPANNYVEVTAVYDHPIHILKKRHHVHHPNFYTEVVDRVQKGIDSQVKSAVGTIESIASDEKTAVLLTEFGNRIRVRLK